MDGAEVRRWWWFPSFPRFCAKLKVGIGSYVKENGAKSRNMQVNKREMR